MHRWLSRAMVAVRERGFRGACLRALRASYGQLILCERILSEPVAEARAGTSVTVALLSIEDLHEYLAFHKTAEPTDIRRRFLTGHKCFVARHGDSIASIAWASPVTAHVGYLSLAIQLADDEMYVYGSYTAPCYRNRNIPAVRGNEMVRHFRDLGYSRLIAGVIPTNKPAFRPIEKIGYRRFGRIATVRLGAWRYDFCHTARTSRPITICRETPSRSGLHPECQE